MYAIIPQQIPQGMRAEVNEKILFAIDSGKNLIPAESIYNCYTGIGGLHNLKQSDFASYHEYAEAKKEFEMGQFFTPHEICRDMVDMLCPVSSEMVLDMCCGMGNFFNHLPNPHNAYGFDIDGKAVSVARYLYPEAHIEKCDIRQYYPEQRFDVIIGNPPFNLKFDYKLSQEYYMDKAYDVLNPAGILMVIVPCSFMQSGFWEKTRIAGINGRFSFVGQTKLGPSAFAAVGVHDFNTKIMVFLRKSGHIKMQAYNAEEFITADELKKRIGEARAMKHRLRFDLMRETNRINKEELELFEYKLSKYLNYLSESFLLNRAVRYDVKGKKYINTLSKYYFTDIGLRNAILDMRQQEETHIMENIIYNELIVRGYSVDVGMVEIKKPDKDGKWTRIHLEVDFIATLGSKKYYIQSALSIPDREKEIQESRSLTNINDSFKKIIVVKDHIMPRRNEEGILTVGLFDFLLKEDSLDI